MIVDNPNFDVDDDLYYTPAQADGDFHMHFPYEDAQLVLDHHDADNDIISESEANTNIEHEPIERSLPPEVLPPEVHLAPSPPGEVLQESASHWFWRILLVLTAWLHLHYHLPHRACILLLKVLRVIFIGLSQLKPEDEAPVTLTTTFRRLNLDDEFQISPSCPKCHRIYATDSPASLKCSHCDIPLFKFWAGEGSTSSKKAAPKPVIQCPQRSITSQLPRILNSPGMEEACEAWCTETTRPGFKTTIMDGKIWKTIAGCDGKPFFDNRPDRDHSDELRIGITIGFDGYIFDSDLFLAVLILVILFKLRLQKQASRLWGFTQFRCVVKLYC